MLRLIRVKRSALLLGWDANAELQQRAPPDEEFSLYAPLQEKGKLVTATFAVNTNPTLVSTLRLPSLYLSLVDDTPCWSAASLLDRGAKDSVKQSRLTKREDRCILTNVYLASCATSIQHG